MNMQLLFFKSITLILCLFSITAYTQDNFTWQNKQYQSHLIDFNGDGLKDLLLQSLNEETPSLLIIGELVDNNLRFLPNNQQTLPQHIDTNGWSSDFADVVVADFNGDSHDDLLVVFPSLQVALTYLGSDEGIDFSIAPSHTYNKKQFAWLKKQGGFDLYPGAFNGNGRDGLLALSLSTEKHFLMHSDENGLLTVAQKINKNSAWGREGLEKLIIADYNGDGKEDVFALAKKKSQSNYLVLANNKGKLKTATEVTNQLQGQDWNGDDYSIIAGFGDSDDTLDLIRLNNMPGGIDENGEEVGLLTTEEVESLSASCDQLYISATGEEGKTCQPWQTVTTSASTQQVSSFSTLDNTGIAAMALPPSGGGGFEPPPSPIYTPSVSGGSSHPYSTNVTVNITFLFNAAYYKLYTSTDGSSYSYVKSFDDRQTNFVIRNTWGYQYIKYKACNQYGCGGLSPYKKIQAYDSPYETYPKSTPTSIYKKATSLIKWPNPGHIIWSGTHYERYYTEPSGNTVNLSNINHKSGDTKTNFTTPTLNNSGVYTFYVRACNPLLPCGLWGSATVTVINRPPNAANDSIQINEDSGSITISVLANDTDPDGDSLIIKNGSVTNAGHGTSSQYGNYKVKYTPNLNYCNDNTSDSFKYIVSDGDGGESEVTVSVKVKCINDAPVIIGNSVGDVVEDGSLTLALGNFTVTDVDSSALTLVVYANSNYSVSGSTISPTANYDGNLSVKIKVKDDKGAYSGYYYATIDVTPIVQTPNTGPVITGDPSVSVNVGTVYTFTPQATDEDIDDSLNFSLNITSPSWLAFDSNTGTLTGTPQVSDVGTVSNIILSVSDGTDSASLLPFEIEVSTAIPTKTIIFIHTDLLGSPVAETDAQGSVL